MPNICFSYPPDLPDSQNLSAARPALAGLRRMPLPCFSYPAMCFGYPADVPLGVRNPDAAQPPLPGLRRMPYPCFRY
jgi:hypothetical protein